MLNIYIELNGKRVVNCYIQDFKIKIVYEDGDFIQIKIKNKGGTDKKIVEFLGNETNDDGQYIKVLTEDKNIEYINYFKVQF